MNSKNVKVVDEHNIDRNANIMFAFDLEGSEYVTYWIERDETQNNIFVSKVIKNLDSTFNLLDIDDSMEKEKISDIIKSLIMTAVNSDKDKLDSNTVTLKDGKLINLMTVAFNKEQRVNVKKSYVTTVKKEVTKVVGEYYDVVIEAPVLLSEEEIFLSVTPVVSEEKTNEVVAPVAPTPVVSQKVLEEVPQFISAPVEQSPVLSTPVVDVANDGGSDDFVAFGTEMPVSTPPVISQPASTSVAVSVPEVSVSVVPETVPSVVSQPSVIESITNSQPVQDNVVQPTPTVVPSPVEPAPVLPIVEPSVQAAVAVESPKPVDTVEVPVVRATETPVDVSQPLMFMMDKETNLKKALGEAANSQAIPVENIQPVREFGVDEPVKNVIPVSQPVEAAIPQSEVTAEVKTTAAGFANSKFFMVVAVAFFLASCIFLGYEVFQYFQLTK